MNTADIKQWIRRELPVIFREDVEIRQFILDLTRSEYADKQITESRFDRILDEYSRIEKNNAVNGTARIRKWDEQNRKWDENQQVIKDVLARIDAQQRKYDGGIGAIGSRWGFQAEEAFRNALTAILEQSFGVQVVNVTEFDDTGEVFEHRIRLNWMSLSTTAC